MSAAVAGLQDETYPEDSIIWNATPTNFRITVIFCHYFPSSFRDSTKFISKISSNYFEVKPLSPPVTAGLRPRGDHVEREREGEGGRG